MFDVRSIVRSSRHLRIFAIILIVCLLLACNYSVSGDFYEQQTFPMKGRSSALLTALFHYDAPATRNTRNDGQRFHSASPGALTMSGERAKVTEFAQSLIYEGGFFPSEIYQLLGLDNKVTSRVARITRQLDRASGKAPAPWEVAGRIGRSGMAGSSDNWAMAPGESDEDSLPSPGTLAYLPALAVTYASYPEDGLEAASQLAVLKDDDMRAASTARAGIGLLMTILVSERPDKDSWLRKAAAGSGDPDTDRDIRSVRMKDWRYLRGEECAMGRLERAIHIWYKGDGYQEIMAEGTRNLRSREGLAYLASLAAATYGMESLPNNVIAKGAGDVTLRELINDLYDLGTSEAVLRVAPPEE